MKNDGVLYCNIFFQFAYLKPEPAQKFRLRLQQKVTAPPALALQYRYSFKHLIC
jgi:hypothetical protein